MSTTVYETKNRNRKVRKACSNCQGTHAKCSPYRPCLRCISRRCEDSCSDIPAVIKPTKYAELAQHQPVVVEQPEPNMLVTEQFFRFMDNIDIYIDMVSKHRTHEKCNNYDGYFQM